MATVALTPLTLIFTLNRYYRHLLEALVDEGTWDKSEAAIGLSQEEITITGTTIPGNLTVEILHKVNSQPAVVRTEVESDGSGNFSATIRVQRGINEISARLQDGTVSVSVFVNGYNFHLFLELFASEALTETEEQFEQSRANQHLFATKDILDSQIREPTDKAIRDNFGVLTDVLRPEAFSSSQYRQLIRDLLASYQVSVVKKGIIDVVQAFLSIDPVFTLYNKFNTGFRLGTSVKLVADKVSAATQTLDLIIRKGRIQFNHKVFIVKETTLTLPDDSTSFIFFDGTLTSEGYAEIKQATIAPTGLRKDLGTVVTVSGDIESILGSQRLGTDARLRKRSSKFFRYEVLIPDGTVTAEIKGFIRQSIKSVKPAHTVALVRFSDETFATAA